ncbi:MAG: glycosyltransferase family 4 protein [Verrucomicrobia bacterium]|nr:glycosyltransferase family 4 protein [Verrucomicrobiota bacterium]
MRAPPIGSPPLCVITHEFFPQRGGIATFAEEMARAAARAGHAVEVWAPQTRVTKADWPFPIRHLPLAGTHNWGCQMRLARELLRDRRRLRQSSIYLAEPGPMLVWMLLQFAGALRPRRLVLTVHGSEVLRFAHHPWRRRLAACLFARADRISTLTAFTADLVRRHFPESEGKLVLTPGALRSDFGVAPRAATRKGAGSVVLTVGRLHPRKGQLRTLQALQRLPEALRAGLEYRVVGTESDPGYAQTLRAEAARSDFRVTFWGDVPDAELPAIYAGADVFALTSIQHGHSVEGFGLVYLEASAQGLPVVAHAVGGVSEAVADGQTGLLVPPDRPEDLTAAFARVLADGALRRRLGEEGRRWAGRTSWAASAAALFGPGPIQAL